MLLPFFNYVMEINNKKILLCVDEVIGTEILKCKYNILTHSHKCGTRTHSNICHAHDQ